MVSIVTTAGRRRKKTGWDSASKILLILTLILGLSWPRWSVAADIILTASEWPPFTSQTLPGGGFFTEICQAALAEGGHRSTVVFLPWKRVLKWTEKGRLHGIIGAGYTPARAVHFIYSEFYLEVPFYFFAKKDRNFRPATVKDFCPAAIGVYLGSCHADALSAFGCFDIQPVPSVSQNIKKLDLDRIDFVLESRQAFLFYLNRDCPGLSARFTPVGPPFKNEKIHLAFSKQLPFASRIARDFDRGMERIKAMGIHDDILRRHKVGD